MSALNREKLCRRGAVYLQGSLGLLQRGLQLFLFHLDLLLALLELVDALAAVRELVREVCDLLCWR